LSGRGPVTVKKFRKFLREHQYEKVRSKGGHEHWKPGNKDVRAKRTITFQSHLKEIPTFVLRNNLENMNLSLDYFYNWLQKK
jgi:predicted RNA binding protein YcfA (HicA-like mRNA interferase family)